MKNVSALTDINDSRSTLKSCCRIRERRHSAPSSNATPSCSSLSEMRTRGIIVRWLEESGSDGYRSPHPLLLFSIAGWRPARACKNTEQTRTISEVEFGKESLYDSRAPFRNGTEPCCLFQEIRNDYCKKLSSHADCITPCLPTYP